MKSLPDKLTVGEAYGPAMGILTQEEADEYFEMLVERNMRLTGNSREGAEAIERSNLGYYAGYYDVETGQRVNQLFKTFHPIFGIAAPTADEAFEMGRKLAEKRKK